MITDDDLKQGWLYGWKEIVAYMGVGAKTTLRRWEKKFGCPIIRGPNGRPLAHRAVLSEWLTLFAVMDAKERRALAKQRKAKAREEG